MNKLRKFLKIYFIVIIALIMLFSTLKSFVHAASEDAEFNFYIKPDVECDFISGKVINEGFNISIKDSVTNQVVKSAVTNEDGFAKFNDSIEKYKNKLFDVVITKDNYLTRAYKNVSFQAITYFGDEDNPVLMYPGDIAISGVQDNAINMQDIMYVAKCFNSLRGEERFEMNADLNMDKSVSMLDIMAIAKHFNSSSYPESTPTYVKPTPKPTTTPAPTADAHNDSKPLSIEAEKTTFGTNINYKVTYINGCDDGEYLIVPNVCYGCGCNAAKTINLFEVNAAVPNDKAGCQVEIRLGAKDGELLGTLTLTGTGGRSNYTIQGTSLDKTRNYGLYASIYLVFKGGSDIADFDKFNFVVTDEKTPAPSGIITTPTPIKPSSYDLELSQDDFDSMRNVVDSGMRAISYNDGWIEFKNVNFDRWPVFATDEICRLTVGTFIKNIPANCFSYFEVRLDDPTNGEVISAFKASASQCNNSNSTGFYNTIEFKLYSGLHNVYVVFKGDGSYVCEFDKLSLTFGYAPGMAPTPTTRLYTATPLPSTKPDNIIELQAENYSDMKGVVKNGTYIDCSDKSWIKFNKVDLTKLKQFITASSFEPYKLMIYRKSSRTNMFESVEVRMDSLYGPVIGKRLLSAWGLTYGTSCFVDGYLEHSLVVDSTYTQNLLNGSHDIYVVFDSFNGEDMGSFDRLVFLCSKS